MYTVARLKKVTTTKSFSKDRLSHFISVTTIILLACIIVMFSALNFNKITEIVKGKSNAPTIVYAEQTQEQPEPLVINF